MSVHLIYKLQKSRFSLNDTLLQRRCNQLLSLVGHATNPLSVIFIDDHAMADYNHTYRGKRGATNVLSFPASELQADLPVALRSDELGDIFISVETARREADKKKISLHHRLTELIIHGLLHLMGHDHEQSTREALIMWEKEQQLLKEIIQPRRKHMPQLAINVDHVATIRQARGITEPDPVIAAGICELAGARGIVVHLREDRRHIQDRDVVLLKQTVKTKMNLEMANVKEIVDIALKLKPDMITLVPEKRTELTTEGGLNVLGNEKKLKKTIAKMKKAGIPVSLFIDPDAAQIEASLDIGATFVELHTGRYCDAENEAEQDREFRLIECSAELAYESGLRVNAGHGLDYRTTTRIAALPTIEELSIGHAVMSRAMYVGLDQAVREMLDCIVSAA